MPSALKGRTHLPCVLLADGAVDTPALLTAILATLLWTRPHKLRTELVQRATVPAFPGHNVPN
jgi:hypothetical protein